jgi:uracil phosphoribosyltransferase
MRIGLITWLVYYKSSTPRTTQSNKRKEEENGEPVLAHGLRLVCVRVVRACVCMYERVCGVCVSVCVRVRAYVCLCV